MTEPLSIAPLRRLGRLAGRTAIITGSGAEGARPGSGSATAVLFASEGANVVVLDFDEARAVHTKEAIDGIGGKAIVALADITEPDQCARVVSETVAAFGGVDVLVNNAAIAPGERGADDVMYQKILNIDLRAAKLMSDVCIPHMIDAGAGSIVMISSTAALQAGGGMAYSAAKAGLIGLAHAMAFEYGRQGIRVNCIAPGHLALPMGLGYTGWGDGVNLRAMRAHASMLGTEGDCWDVATTALFLASDDAKYVTAVTIPVDGGSSTVMPIVMRDYLNAAADSSPDLA